MFKIVLSLSNNHNKTKTKMKNYTMFEMTETGLYDEKAIAKFYNKQLKLNNGNAKVAASMVNIYKHNFKIRTKKPL